ncbi:MAG: FeoB-associated Cys-rich membrane protein [Victivallales bacterium]|nr:FeoB-associated Cys-rich membrane protein [Victivallales bacterium]
MNLASIFLALVIAALFFLAVRRILRNGSSCEACKGHCGACGSECHCSDSGQDREQRNPKP